MKKWIILTCIISCTSYLECHKINQDANAQTIGENERNFFLDLIDSQSGKVATRIRRSFGAVEPQPRFTKSYLYVSPEEVGETIIREKRASKESEESDYDYTRGYRDFVKENFGFDERAKPLADEEYENEEEEDDGYERIKELSDKENEESKKHPEFCKVVQKDGKDCTICKNPKNNAQSESCSYSSSPAPKKYAYKRERNYKSKDEEDDDAEADAEADEEGNDDGGDDGDDYDEENGEKEDGHEEDASEKQEQKVPATVEHDTANYNTQGNLNRRSARYRAINNMEPIPSTSTARPTEQPKTADPSKRYGRARYNSGTAKSVDKVLQEFKTRDWSKCRKKSKNGLTCYYCRDAAGISNEECMYVSDDEPHSQKSDETEETVVNTKRPSREDGKARATAYSQHSENLNPSYTQNRSMPKRNLKRMVSVKINGTTPEELTNRSVYYAKNTTEVSK